jgi:hypothetical protein
VSGGGILGGTSASLQVNSGELYLVVASSSFSTTTALATSGSPSIYGGSVTFTATVQTNGVTAGNATSNYVFKVDGTAVATNTVASGQTIYTTSALIAGFHTITAEYEGDSSYISSTNSLSQTVNQAALTVTANNTNKVYDGVVFTGGNGVTFSGFVNGETNNVLGGILSYGGTSQGATNAGSYIVIPSGLTNATYNNYNIGFANGTLTIDQASTSVGVSSTGNPSGYQDSVSFIATLPSNATGDVVFSSTNAPISTNAVNAGSASSLSITNLPRGTNLITASYSGDVNYLGSTNTLNQVVTNHPPVAADATYYRAQDTSFQITITNLLTNVTDADGDTITLESVGAGTNGATITTNSTYIFYVPGAGANNNSNDSFTYTVNDGFGSSATANILINVYSNGLAELSVPTNGVVNVKFFGVPNSSYIVQTTTNLLTPWSVVSTNTANTNGFWQFIDLNATNAEQYYRAVQP